MLWQGILREGYVDCEGRFYQARGCELRPRGPRPNGAPIWIGARGPRMMRLVARYADGYNTTWHATPDTLAPRWQALSTTARGA